MKKHIIILLLTLCASITASAQSTPISSYFLERAPMRHKLNPALVNEKNYISVPMLGGVNLGVKSNLGLNNFFYPLDNGKLGTFLHKDVCYKLFLEKLKKTNAVDQTFNLTILSTGFHAIGGFNTIDLSVNQTMNLSIKKSMFEFMKVGQQGNSTYNMGGNKIKASSYAELAFGHAHKITENITIGAKAKVLIGVGYADINIDKMDVTMSDDIWKMSMYGSGDVALLGNSLYNDMDKLKFKDIGGGGLAFDLGFTYENIAKDFTFSAAITDLGFIKWKSISNIDLSATTEFIGFEDFDIDDAEDSSNAVFDKIESDLDGIKNPQLNPTGKDRLKSINTSFTVAGEYKLIDNKLTAGLVSTVRLGSKTISENTLSANFRPAKWFNMSVTGTLSSYGPYWGWFLNLCPNNGMNFFIGSDCMSWKVSPQYIPINNTLMNLSFGLSVPF